jgi:hypothetical protein
MLEGGCHCGAVRYEVRGDAFEPVICHCTDCRRVSGAPALAWFSVRTPDFRYVHGAPVQYRSSGRAVREFCGVCGAQITFAEHDLAPRQIDVTTASLDDPETAAPVANIFVRSRIGWMMGIGALPDRAGDFAS